MAKAVGGVGIHGGLRWLALSDCRHGRAFLFVSATAVPAGLFKGLRHADIKAAQDGIHGRGVLRFGAKQFVDLAMAEILPEQGGARMGTLRWLNCW